MDYPSHNLKVVGSNPTPATKLSPVDQAVMAWSPGFSVYNGPFPSVPADYREKPCYSNPTGDFFHPLRSIPKSSWHMNGT